MSYVNGQQKALEALGLDKTAAGRWNDPAAMKSMMTNARLGDAWKAHGAPMAPAAGPVTSNAALTKPADMGRANDMSYWTAQAGGAQAPMAAAAPAAGGPKLTGMDKIRALQQQKLGSTNALRVFGL